MKNMLRVTFVSAIVAALTTATAAHSYDISKEITGSWYNPDESGHGLILEVLADSQLLAYWFTYDEFGNQAWFVGLGTIQGDSASMDIVKTNGGIFGTEFDPTAVVRNDWGNLSITFNSCNTGSVTYNTLFGAGTLALSRLTGVEGLGCANGGGVGAATAIGIFKDSNVAGLGYISGSQTGITGSDGSFTYEVGQNVTFSVGGVTIGTAVGDSVVTPVDLVSGGSSNLTQVQNIVRFLLMLDSDGNANNGIQLSSAVRLVADSWSQVDFSTSDLPSELASIIGDAVLVDGTVHSLPSAATARSHLEATLLCAHAGAYRGTFTGDDNGPAAGFVDANTGFFSGLAFSNTDQELVTLSGITSVSFDQRATFVAGNSSMGSTFNGEFTTVDEITGTWNNTFYSLSGTFAGSRIGGASNAAFRFTGHFTGDATGLYSFDVDGSDNITGVAYSAIDEDLFSLNGSVTGSSISVTASDGTIISGTLNKITGALSGTWLDNTGGLSGAFTGSGCKLN